MKRVLFAAGVVVIVAAGIFFSRTKAVSYATAEATRGPLKQEVLASGNVASPKTINLQFQGTGKIVALSADVGQHVGAGAPLARLDTSVLEAQRAQAEAAVAGQRAQLGSLQDGTRPEQIAVTQSQIESDQTALAQANQAIVNAIQNAYTQSDDAVHNKVDQFFNNPRSFNPLIAFQSSNVQLAMTTQSERAGAEAMLANWQVDVGQVSAVEPGPGVAEAERNLASIAQLLSDANALLNTAISSPQVSAATIAGWTSSAGVARANVNAVTSALTAAVTAQKAAAATLERDKKNLSLQQAGSTQHALDAQAALVQQAQAAVATIDAQIAQATLSAPVAGTITAVNVERGETVTPATVAVTIIPDAKLQIDVNLSEDNVALVQAGQPVRITLDALSGQEINGVVTEVDPAQTIIGGAVYYKTTVMFTTPQSLIKPGMSANVWIQTGAATSTVIVPASAVRAKDGASYVQVVNDSSPSERAVTVGLRGQDGMVEIVSGLSGGETVVTGDK